MIRLGVRAALGTAACTRRTLRSTSALLRLCGPAARPASRWPWFKTAQIAYAKAFGQANIAENRAADAATRYAIGSVSKQFTAAALLLLEERGKISLDDKVGKYLPDLTRAREVTIRELLSHTSGYEDYAPQDYMIPAWTRPITPRADPGSMGQKAAEFRSGNALAIQQYQLCDRGTDL